MLGLGVTPTTILLQAVGSADDPSSGGRQMPAHWGDADRHVVTQSSPTGSQCLPAVGCAEAARYLSRRPHLPGTAAHGDELTYVSLGEGATSEGDFWESLNSACTLHLPVLFVVADNGYAISVPVADQAPAPVRSWCAASGGSRCTPSTAATTSRCAGLAAEAVPLVRAGVGPGADPRPGHPPLLALGRRHPEQVPAAEELAEEAARDPLLTMAAALEAPG